MSLPLRLRLRRLRMGLSTVLGWRRQGFFIPYRYADRMADNLPAYGPIADLLAAHEENFTRLLDAADDLADQLTAIGNDPPPQPRWTQGWFCPLDAAIAYTLVRTRRPARIVEVGSGHSTRFLARAIADGGLSTQLTAIDPVPRADLLTLSLTHLAGTVQSAPTAPFAALEAGDMLFIDSSHLALEGTDVDYLVGRIVPALPAGVLIHIHDVCLPDPYFADWRWRGYNEQTVAAAWMTGGFRPLFASHYAATRMSARLAASVIARLPAIEQARNTSLWLEKTAAPVGALADRSA